MPHQLGDAQVGVRSVRERDWRVWKGEGDMQGWEQARVQGAGPHTSMVREAVRSARLALCRDSVQHAAHRIMHGGGPVPHRQQRSSTASKGRLTRPRRPAEFLHGNAVLQVAQPQASQLRRHGDTCSARRHAVYAQGSQSNTHEAAAAAAEPAAQVPAAHSRAGGNRRWHRDCKIRGLRLRGRKKHEMQERRGAGGPEWQDFAHMNAQ